MSRHHVDRKDMARRLKKMTEQSLKAMSRPKAYTPPTGCMRDDSCKLQSAFAYMCPWCQRHYEALQPHNPGVSK